MNGVSWRVQFIRALVRPPSRGRKVGTVHSFTIRNGAELQTRDSDAVPVGEGTSELRQLAVHGSRSAAMSTPESRTSSMREDSRIRDEIRIRYRRTTEALFKGPRSATHSISMNEHRPQGSVLKVR